MKSSTCKKSSAFITAEDLSNPDSDFNTNARKLWMNRLHDKLLKGWGKEVTPSGKTHGELLYKEDV